MVQGAQNCFGMMTEKMLVGSRIFQGNSIIEMGISYLTNLLQGVSSKFDFFSHF